ncbi:prolipoprotein diacylglyceryl transferase, partial [bacterium]|nr:prolipoprotein diacylglyceryl transferase [bacterium]
MKPVFFEIGSFQIRYFGLFYAAGLTVLYLILRKSARQAGIKLSKEELLDWIVIVFFYGIVGARLYYVLINIEYYTRNDVPWYEFLFIWHGGMSLNGGLITAPCALWLM